MKFETLKRRTDFLHIRGGVRWVTPTFTLLARRAKQTNASDRASTETAASRVGFTVTKRIGNAVRRNRIKRRLREVVRENAGQLWNAGIDYVVIARQGADKRRFEELKRDLELALKRVHGKLRLE